MENKIDELIENLKNLSEKQNSQYTDIMMQLKSVQDQLVKPVDNRNDDDLYEEAREAVIEVQKASTSYLQRIMGIGYARAARLMDTLEENKVIGPGNGAEPRKVLIKE